MKTGVGVAWVRMEANLVVNSWAATLRKFNSVYQAEALAIQEVVNFKNKENIIKTKIYTDSFSVLEAPRSIKNGIHRFKTCKIQ